ncbi:MAG: hypothetical protein AAB573_03800 [Patescibacteria group bacterium]
MALNEIRKLQPLSEISAHDQGRRSWWRNILRAYHNDPKWSVARNKGAYDIAVERRKRDAQRGGLSNPWIFMPKPYGERQRKVPGTFKPFAVDSGDKHTIGAPLDRAIRENRI